MRRAAFIGLVLALAAPASAEELGQPAPSGVSSGQKETGFTLEASFGSRLVDIVNTGLGGTTNVSFGALAGGVFAGYKIGRVMFGIGFDIGRFATSQTTAGNTTTGADTEILFVPGVRVAIVRSKDHRVEMFGQFDLGLGTTIHEPDNTGTTFNLSYVIGPGVRFWVHPQFAVGAVVGIRGDFVYFKNGGDSESTLLTSVFAALQLLGVF